MRAFFDFKRLFFVDVDNGAFVGICGICGI